MGHKFHWVLKQRQDILIYIYIIIRYIYNIKIYIILVTEQCICVLTTRLNAP